MDQGPRPWIQTRDRRVTLDPDLGLSSFLYLAQIDWSQYGYYLNEDTWIGQNNVIWHRLKSQRELDVIKYRAGFKLKII